MTIKRGICLQWHIVTCDTCGTAREYATVSDRALAIQLTLDAWHQEDGAVTCGSCWGKTEKEEK